MITLCAECVADGSERPAVTMLEGTALCTQHARRQARRPESSTPPKNAECACFSQAFIDAVVGRVVAAKAGEVL